MTLKITKQPDKIIITPEGSYTDFGELVNDIELSMNDLQIHFSGMDGWTYLYDANTNMVGKLDDYGFNRLDELYNGHAVIVEMVENYKSYEGYEWNEEQ